MESSRPPNHATPTLAFFPPQNSSPSDYALFHLTTSPDNWIMNLIYWTRQRPIQNSRSISLRISRHDNSSCSPTVWDDWGKVSAFPTTVYAACKHYSCTPHSILYSYRLAWRPALRSSCERDSVRYCHSCDSTCTLLYRRVSTCSSPSH